MTEQQIKEKMERAANMTPAEIELANVSNDAVAAIFAIGANALNYPAIMAVSQSFVPLNDEIAAARYECAKLGLTRYAAALARFYVVDGELYQD